MRFPRRGPIGRAGAVRRPWVPLPKAPANDATLIRVVEHPPMRQYILATTPRGSIKRWGEDEGSAENVLQDLSDSDTAPSGGYKDCSGTLPRRGDVDYDDMAPGTDLKIYGAGRVQIGEYRLEDAPMSSGDYLVLSPAAVGYQAHLSDDESAQGIPLDSDMSAWGETSAARQVVVGATAKINSDGQVALLPAGDPAGGNVPAIQHSFGHISNALGAVPDVAESSYDSNGVELGKVMLDFVAAAGLGAGWINRLLAGSDDLPTLFETLKDFAGSSGEAHSLEVAPERFFLFLQDYISTAKSEDGRWAAQWRSIKIQDRSGIPIYGTWPNVGVLASDVIAYALPKWAPLLNFTTVGDVATIKPTSFLIPHLTFKEPGPIANWVTKSLSFELKEWGVWNNRTFYLNGRGERPGRKRWRARMRPTEYRDAGRSSSRSLNGCIVEYPDPDGTTKIIGPPGSGYRQTDARLLDTDPLNLANQLPNSRSWGKVTLRKMATSSGAAEAGQLVIEKSKLFDTAGEATLKGYVEDEKRQLWPYYCVHAGDVIEFIDAAFPGPRYIISATRNRSQRATSIVLDSPPDTWEALMAELDAEFEALSL